jgi:hypothetical protein
MKSPRLASFLWFVVMTCSVGSVAAGEREDARALALGDSVVFGFITQAGHEYVNASNFIGVPGPDVGPGRCECWVSRGGNK